MNDKKLMHRAMADLQFGYAKYIKGKQEGLIGWETPLGEFLAYSGIAYYANPRNRGPPYEAHKAYQRLGTALGTTREGIWGQCRAVRLKNLKTLMEGPKGKRYPKYLGRPLVQLLNAILAQHGLQPIRSRKLTKQDRLLESRLFIDP